MIPPNIINTTDIIIIIINFIITINIIVSKIIFIIIIIVNIINIIARKDYFILTIGENKIGVIVRNRTKRIKLVIKILKFSGVINKINYILINFLT